MEHWVNNIKVTIIVTLRRSNIFIILPITYQHYIHYNNIIQVVYYYTITSLVYLNLE